MLSNYEKVYKIILPKLRESSAKILATNYGKTQEEIASLLGVTQAAVSKYLNPNKVERKSTGIVIRRSKLKKMVEGVVSRNDSKAQRHMCSICQDNVNFKCRLIVK